MNKTTLGLLFFFILTVDANQVFSQSPNNDFTICNFLVQFADTLYRYEYGEHFGGYVMQNPSSGKDQATLITGGTDNFIDPTQPILPMGVGRCMRVGDKQAGSKAGMVRLETICLVEQVSLHYRMVADKVENHEEGQYPYLKIRVMDENRQNLYCFDDFLYVLEEGMPGVSISPLGKLYTAWRELPLNLQPFFGRKIIIEVETGDCSMGEHLAYAYFYFKCSDEASPLSNTSPLGNIIEPPKVITGCPTGSPKLIKTKPGFKFHHWSNGQGGSSITITEPGVYKVRASLDATNCQGIDSVVYYPDLAYLKIVPRFYCPGYGITLSVQNFDPNSADQVDEVEWDIEADGSFEHKGNHYDVFLTKSTWVLAKIKTRKGCVFTMKKKIIRAENSPNPSFKFIIEQISGTCYGNTTRIIAGNYQQVNWDIGNDGSFEVVDKLQLFYQFPKLGSHPVRMRVVDKTTGCFRDTVFSVTITEATQPEIFTARPFACMGERIQFIPTFVNPPTRVQWDLDGDGYYDPRIRPVNFTPDTVFLFPGVRQVGIRAFRGATCVDTLRKTIEIYSFPFGQIVGEKDVCSYRPVGKYWPDTRFEVASVDWKPTNGLIERTSGDTVWVAWLKNRTYHSLEATVTSVQGCSYPYDPLSIKIWPSPVTQTPVGETFVCLDDPIRGYSVLPTVGYGYEWQVENGEILSGQGTERIFVRWLKSGKGAVYLAPSHVLDTICFDRSPKLEVQIAPAKDTLVELVRVSVETDNAVDIFWRIEGEDTSENVLIDRDKRFLGKVPKSQGRYRDSSADLGRPQLYSLATYNRCADTVKSLSHQNIALRVAFSETEKTIDLEWNPYINWPEPPAYQIWTSQDGDAFKLLITTDELSQTFANGNDAFLHCFRVRAIGQNGLQSNSNTVCVRFKHQVKINEFLTPNGDGLNDRLVVESLSRYPDNELIVLNRFGQKVYSKAGYDNTWQGDGLEGTYFCIFSYRLPDGTWGRTASALTILR